MSLQTRRWTAALLGAALLVSACDDDDDDGGNGPGTGNTLSPAEVGVLIDALIGSGAIDDPSSAALVFLVLEGEVGTMTIATPTTAVGAPDASFSMVPSGGSYDALAFQADVSVNGVNEQVITGMLAWKGINVNAGTVDEVILWFGESEPPGFPSTLTVTFPFDGGGTYSELATNSLYAFVSGVGEIFGASFGGSTTDCSGTFEGVTVECSAQSGTLEGGWEATANLQFGTAEDQQFTVPFSSFELPAARLTVDATIPVQ